MHHPDHHRQRAGRALHERMPVILPADAYRLWLDPTIQRAEPLLPQFQAVPRRADGSLARQYARQFPAERRSGLRSVRGVRAGPKNKTATARCFHRAAAGASSLFRLSLQS